MRIGTYIRVSSKAQNFALQVDAIGKALPEGSKPATYREKASARTNDRPELQRMLADAQGGKLTDLYVFKLDRLCRTGVADTFRIVSQLRSAGVTLHAVADNLVIKPGADDIVSETLVFALSLAAKLERSAINDRISAARARHDDAGLSWGRPKRMTPAEVETARRMRAEGKPGKVIAAALGVPVPTVNRTLRLTA